MKLSKYLLLALISAYGTAAMAIPSLQLAGDGSDGWSYNGTTDTWEVTSPSFGLYAYANATTANGGNGSYAWDAAGSTDQYAYLILAAVQDPGDIGDVFDVTVGGASLVNSGYGAPPIEDTNDPAPHGIYDTYFEVYEFQFDGSIVDINDEQPGETGTGKGYAELFSIDINELLGDVTGVHFDLFTTTGARWDPSDLTADKKLVNAFAPFSHDAAFIPEPGVLGLLGLGLVVITLCRRKK